MPLTQSVLLPGDVIAPSDIPTSKKANKALAIGPGLKYTPPSTIALTVAGALQVDPRKPALWIESNGGRVSVFKISTIVKDLLTKRVGSMSQQLATQ